MSRNKKNKQLFIIEISLITVLIFVFLGIKIPDDFSSDTLINKIEDNLITNNDSILSEITKNPLYYIGNGKQSIAFVSTDKFYVIKFFLKKPIDSKIKIRFPLFLKRLHSTNINRIHDRTDILKRYYSAFEKAPNETGLISIYINNKIPNLPSCKIIDYNKKEHLIDLNKHAFVIQRYGKCVKNTFSKLSKKEKKHFTTALEKLFETLSKKGLLVLGKSFKQDNYAFIDDKAIIIDLGNVVFDKQQINNPDKEIKRLKNLFIKWNGRVNQDF